MLARQLMNAVYYVSLSYRRARRLLKMRGQNSAMDGTIDAARISGLRVAFPELPENEAVRIARDHRREVHAYVSLRNALFVGDNVPGSLGLVEIEFCHSASRRKLGVGAALDRVTHFGGSLIASRVADSYATGRNRTRTAGRSGRSPAFVPSTRASRRHGLAARARSSVEQVGHDAEQGLLLARARTRT